jgi:predicted RNA-binding Zn-ribbon protein involved in translation (DUF1610 family)
MPKCPECGEEISELKANTVEYCTYWFYVEDNQTHYENDDSEVDEIYFCCPKCGKTLFTDEPSAEKFLLGE